MNRPFACALASALTFSALTAGAQETARIQFEPGNDNAAVSGTVTGDAYADYVLGASAGQTMAAALSVETADGTGSAFFNILPPGSDNVAIFNGSMSTDGYGAVELPETGDYTIRVYLMGNDRDADKTVGYTLSVTIE